MTYLLRKLRERQKLRKIILERLTEPLHLNFAAMVALMSSYKMRVAFDLVVRPQYAYGILRAAELAGELNIQKIACLEFGVASGAGLMNMAHLARRTERATGVSIHVHGFDTGKGMPDPVDHRDHPELYGPGDYPMDIAALRAKLPANTTLSIGPLSQTIHSFMAELDCPIGFVALDVDYYSSSVEALQIFDDVATRYLPATLMYVDDIALWSHHPWAGELLAIREFNEAHSERKIAKQDFLRCERIFKNASWIDHFFSIHVLDHPVRQKAATERSRYVISNPYL
jgi:hypothetical protein